MAADDEGEGKVPGHGMLDKLKDSKHKNLYILLLTLAGVIIAYLTYRKMSAANAANAAATTGTGTAGTTTTSGGDIGYAGYQGPPGATGQPGTMSASQLAELKNLQSQAAQSNKEQQLLAQKIAALQKQLAAKAGKKQPTPAKPSKPLPVTPVKGLTPPGKGAKPEAEPNLSTHAAAGSNTTHPGGVQHKVLGKAA